MHYRHVTGASLSEVDGLPLDELAFLVVEAIAYWERLWNTDD
jgi:hypothetical protein